VEFLKFHKLTPSLMGYILDAIAMVSPAASLLQVLPLSPSVLCIVL